MARAPEATTSAASKAAACRLALFLRRAYLGLRYFPLSILFFLLPHPQRTRDPAPEEGKRALSLFCAAAQFYPASGHPVFSTGDEMFPARRINEALSEGSGKENAAETSPWEKPVLSFICQGYGCFMYPQQRCAPEKTVSPKASYFLGNLSFRQQRSG